MKAWVKYPDPNNKYGARFTFGDKDIPLPETAMISVTRGEKFNVFRIIINGIVNEFIKKQLIKNENLIYAELSGQLQGGIGQTVTVCIKKYGRHYNGGKLVRQAQKPPKTPNK